MHFAYKTQTITLPADDSPVVFFEAVKESCFHCRNCLWLKAIKTTLNLIRKPAGSDSISDLPWRAFDQVSQDVASTEQKTQSCQIILQNILKPLTGYTNSIGRLTNNQSSILHHCVGSAINAFLVGGSCKMSRRCVIFKTLPFRP